MLGIVRRTLSIARAMLGIMLVILQIVRATTRNVHAML
jgi:hypothetical protein